MIKTTSRSSAAAAFKNVRTSRASHGCRPFSSSSITRTRRPRRLPLVSTAVAIAARRNSPSLINRAGTTTPCSRTANITSSNLVRSTLIPDTPLPDAWPKSLASSWNAALSRDPHGVDGGAQVVPRPAQVLVPAAHVLTHALGDGINDGNLTQRLSDGLGGVDHQVTRPRLRKPVALNRAIARRSAPGTHGETVTTGAIEHLRDERPFLLLTGRLQQDTRSAPRAAAVRRVRRPLESLRHDPGVRVRGFDRDRVGVGRRAHDHVASQAEGRRSDRHAALSQSSNRLGDIGTLGKCVDDPVAGSQPG